MKINSRSQSLSIVGKSYARTKSKMPLSVLPIKRSVLSNLNNPQRNTIYNLELETRDDAFNKIEDFRAAIMWYLDPIPF